MYLLLKQLKGNASAQLMYEYDDAVESARLFCGDHNPVDGCSTILTEQSRSGQHGREYHCYRSSSFGKRSGTVVPIDTTFETKLVF